MSAAAIPLVIGGVSSLVGAGLAANAASKNAKAEQQAAREARAFANQQYQLGELKNLARILGGERALEMFLPTLGAEDRDILFGRAAADPSFSEQQAQRVRDLQNERAALTQYAGWNRVGISGGESAAAKRVRSIDKELEQLRLAAGGQDAFKGLIDMEEVRGIRGLLGDYQDLSAQARREGTDNLSRYDNESQALDQQARDMEAQATRFGQQRGERARRDAAEALKGSNQAATAAMAARGLLGSSALTGALGENATQNQRALSDTLGGIEDEQIRLRTGLQTGRLGLNSSRAQGRSAMQLAGQDTARSLDLGALNLTQNSLTGPASMGWYGQNMTNYFSSASPSAAALGTIGQGLMGVGSPIAGYGLGGAFGGSSGGGASGGGGGGGTVAGGGAMTGGLLGGVQLTPNTFYTGR